MQTRVYHWRSPTCRREPDTIEVGTIRTTGAPLSSIPLMTVDHHRQDAGLRRRLENDSGPSTSMQVGIGAGCRERWALEGCAVVEALRPSRGRGHHLPSSVGHTRSGDTTSRCSGISSRARGKRLISTDTSHRPGEARPGFSTDGSCPPSERSRSTALPRPRWSDGSMPSAAPPPAMPTTLSHFSGRSRRSRPRAATSTPTLRGA